MNETHTNPQGQKPRTSKLAVVSLLLAIPVVVVSVVGFFHFMFIYHTPCFVKLLLLVLVLVSFVLGIVSLYHIGRSEGKQKGAAFAYFGIGAVIVSTLLASLALRGGGHGHDLMCRNRLHSLKVALELYSYNNDGRYPTADKWCDLIEDFVLKGGFVCPAKRRTGERCSYAINPNCQPNSPNDVVLLFETKGGWNQFGGPEMLSTENHPNKRHWFWGYQVSGCNILFNDTHAQFVDERRFKKLKWK